jgi:WXG100 family type VII secretion target
MSKIVISPEQLEQVAKQFKRASEESLMVNTKLKQKINFLESQWQGAAQRDFYMRYRQSQKVMENFCSSLTSISLELERIAKRFREADEGIQKSAPGAVFSPGTSQMPDKRTMAIPEEGYKPFDGSIRMPDGHKEQGRTTLALGEEGDADKVARTMAYPEEGPVIQWDGPIRMPEGDQGPILRTMAIGIGEEGPSKPDDSRISVPEGDKGVEIRTMAIGEDSSGEVVYRTMAIPEEGPYKPLDINGNPEGNGKEMRTMAIGEDGRGEPIGRTMAIGMGEEGPVSQWFGPIHMPKEDNGPSATTMAIGEEGDQPVRTAAVGEK